MNGISKTRLALNILGCVAIVTVVFSVLGIVIYLVSNNSIAKGIAENNNINGSDSACSANSFLIGDGVCDEVTNNEKCLFDSGDCCRQDAESKKYCTSCLCDFAVDKTDYDDKIQNFKVRRFELDDSIQMATETSLDLVASLQVCSWLCLNSTTTNAWTWDPSTLVCNCVSLLEEYHCQNYFLNELSLDDDSASKTVYIKRRLVYLKKYCTNKLLVLGGGADSKNEIVKLEGNSGGQTCNGFQGVNQIQKYGSTAGFVATANVVVVCGGSLQRRPEYNSEAPESSQCEVSSKFNDGIQVISLMTSRINSASIVIEESSTLFVNGGHVFNGYTYAHLGESTELFWQAGKEKSTELVSVLDNQSQDGPTLPFEMAHHCFLTVNETLAFAFDGRQSFLFQIMDLQWEILHDDFPYFVSGEENDSLQRYSCSSMIGDSVKNEHWVVVTGIAKFNDQRATVVDNTFVWNSVSGEWREGPLLPMKLCCGSMVSSSDGGSAFLIGGKFHLEAGPVKSIYKFRCWADNVEECHWHLMSQKLEVAREGFTSIMVPTELTTCGFKEEETLTSCFQDHILLVGDGFCDDSSNTEECLYDGNDCCQTAASTDFCQDCICHKSENVVIEVTTPELLTASKDCLGGNDVGDNICDDQFNTKECAYDGGDCCGEDSWSLDCQLCWCYLTDFIPPLVCPIDKYHLLYDGSCNDLTNSVECGFDSSSCCEAFTESYFDGLICTSSNCRCHLEATDISALGYQCEHTKIIADGICDDEANTPECVYDVGDCCWHKNDYSQCLECHCFQEKDLDVEAFKLSASTAFCHDSKLSLLGDGICDDETNNFLCGFDHLDCCNPADIFAEIENTINCFWCHCHLAVVKPVTDLNDWLEQHLQKYKGN